MGIIQKIQDDLVSGSGNITSSLMKLRLVAARLGSIELEEWVKYEAEGYPSGTQIPEYRILGIGFSGTFSGPFQSRIENAPIPPALIGRFCGKGWQSYAVRQSTAALELMAADPGGLHLDLSNLILLLSGKIYPDYEPVQVKGYISQAVVVEALNAVRSRLLEFTIEMEKRVPGLSSAELGMIEKKPEVASQVFHQTVYGNLTHVQSSGSNASIQVRVEQGSAQSVERALKDVGLNASDAQAVAQIIKDEKPEGGGLGPRLRSWLGQRLTNGIDAGIKGGASAVVAAVEQAAVQYWG